ncbi:hypothetical protein [uncultured Roseibium sp.]|uniref:hypothetical protein n=1 Tax=uncultured Roseibium sp. TaxID=1936171 RepID=UPI00263462AE|nr:hypothetical protein [uncultured Roseibium sp.]
MLKFVAGLFLGISVSAASAQLAVTCAERGMLKGYIVTKGDQEICRDPMTWADFKGQGSFIVCE